MAKKTYYMVGETSIPHPNHRYTTASDFFNSIKWRNTCHKTISRYDEFVKYRQNLSSQIVFGEIELEEKDLFERSEEGHDTQNKVRRLKNNIYISQLKYIYYASPFRMPDAATYFFEQPAKKITLEGRNYFAIDLIQLQLEHSLKRKNELLEEMIVLFEKYQGAPLDETSIAEIKSQLAELDLIIQKLDEDIQETSATETFRILEVGCGNNIFIPLIADILSKTHHKKIHYTGIDISVNAIKSCKKEILSFGESISGNCEYICYDAGNKDWLLHIGDHSFNTAIFIYPVIEVPATISTYISELEAQSLFSKANEAKENLARIKKQCDSMLPVFSDILPRCMKDNASLLFVTKYQAELSEIKQLLAKNNLANPSHHIETSANGFYSLVTIFDGPVIESRHECVFS